jgi:hypothetical protein
MDLIGVQIFLESIVHRILLRAGIDLVPVGDRGSHLATVRRCIEDGMLLNGPEGYQLMELVRESSKVPGDLAEVGVYRGGSARLICSMKGDRRLHLFDTFEGLPHPGEQDSGTPFKKGMYSASLQLVQRYLNEFPNCVFYPGLFPESAGDAQGVQFAFVHVDVDLYEAVVACLRWFYPRMSSGAVLLCHDYYHAGVRQAITEFFCDKPEPVVQQPAGSHCLFVKL